MKRFPTILLAAGLFAATAARADDIAETGRALLKKHQDAIVNIKIVAKIAIPGRESTQEIKLDAIGIMLDPTGLTVASLRIVEPGEVLSRMIGREFQSEIADLRLVLADRTEVPAALVLRDKDLDLAFLRPTEKLPKPGSVIAIDNAAKPDVLDSVVVLSRSTRTPRFDPLVDIERIAAIVDKPRLFYIGSPAIQNSAPGSSIFASDGRFIGQLLTRRTARGEIWTVIVPAADIAETAKQAPAEAKKAAPAPAPSPAK